MSSNKQLPALLELLDPARNVELPPTTRAEHLIARAEARAGGPTSTRSARARPGHRRRAILVAACAGFVATAVAACAGFVATAVAATAGQLHLLGPPGAGGSLPRNVPGHVALGPVVIPIAYEIRDDAPPAAEPLRRLARNIGPAAYDGETGRYAYRHSKSWGATKMVSAEGYVAGFVEEEETWTAADGTGRHIRRTVALEFPNDESRRYWQRQTANNGSPAIPNEEIQDLPFESSAPGSPTASPGTDDPRNPALPADQTLPPSGRSGLAELLRAQHGPYDAAKWTMELYRAYVVPMETRRTVLQILASLNGFVWRGRVTDRVGRAGVAISVDVTDDESRDAHQMVLVFDPRTGELLAWEQLRLIPHRETSAYGVILPTGRVGTIGNIPQR